jgi:hypothetical protein
MFSKTFYAGSAEVAERIWNAIALVNQSAAFQDLRNDKYAD